MEMICIRGEAAPLSERPLSPDASHFHVFVWSELFRLSSASLRSKSLPSTLLSKYLTTNIPLPQFTSYQLIYGVHYKLPFLSKKTQHEKEQMHG